MIKYDDVDLYFYSQERVLVPSDTHKQGYVMNCVQGERKFHKTKRKCVCVLYT